MNDTLEPIGNNQNDINGNLPFDFSRIDNPEPTPNDMAELPIWGLPDDLQRIVKTVSNGHQCSRDYVVASLIAAAAASLGKRVSCKFGNYKNYPTLWIAIVGNTASGKTAPLSFFFTPIDRKEREAHERYLHELEQFKEGDKRPVFHHIVLNNPSDESILYELSTNGSLCWKADELTTLFDGLGQYSKNSGNIIGNLLSIFNNGDVCVTRATKEPQYLIEPNLNIVGGIQPSVLKRVMRSKGFVENGFFQRILYVCPEPREIPQYSNIEIPNNVVQAWESTINRLLNLQDIKMTETTTANKLHQAAINRWRDECNNNYKENDVMVALLRKLEIHLCRWSIVVAALCNENVITDNIMKYSIECMDYFRLCGERAFCLIENREEIPKLTRTVVIKQLLSWYPNVVKSQLAKVLGIERQTLNDFIKR